MCLVNSALVREQGGRLALAAMEISGVCYDQHFDLMSHRTSDSISIASHRMHVLAHQSQVAHMHLKLPN